MWCGGRNICMCVGTTHKQGSAERLRHSCCSLGRAKAGRPKGCSSASPFIMSPCAGERPLMMHSAYIARSSIRGPGLLPPCVCRGVGKPQGAL